MAPPVEIKPLRVCRICGLEAWTKEDLNFFKKGRRYKHGYQNWCKKCANKRLKLPESSYLRKCRVCGLKAYALEELKMFVERKISRYGRRNICIECYKAQYRKKGKYFEKKSDYGKYWRKNNPIKYKILDSKKINFKGKHIRFKENPRTNICSFCGRQYPKELKKQTILHHRKYDSKTPLKYTIELCQSCHNKIHDSAFIKRKAKLKGLEGVKRFDYGVAKEKIRKALKN